MRVKYLGKVDTLALEKDKIYEVIKAENCTYGYYQTVIKASATKPVAKGFRAKIFG